MRRCIIWPGSWSPGIFSLPAGGFYVLPVKISAWHGPQAIPIVKACVDSALQLGLPEARLPLADATILLCTAPKSNAGVLAIDAAMADVKNGKTGDIPAYLKDSHYSGAKKLGRGLTYQYPHPYPGHYYPQQYLPDEIRDRYTTSFRTTRPNRRAAAYRKQILGLWEEKGKK